MRNKVGGFSVDLEPDLSAAGGQSDNEGGLADLPIRQYMDCVRTDRPGSEYRDQAFCSVNRNAAPSSDLPGTRSSTRMLPP